MVVVTTRSQAEKLLGWPPAAWQGIGFLRLTGRKRPPAGRGPTTGVVPAAADDGLRL